MAAINEQIGKDIIVAMKAKDSLRLETLRMVKAAVQNKEIEKREPLTDAETVAVLNTLVKQRQDSAEQFAKGNRPELAQKEQDEIKLLQVYLPQSASEDEIRTVIQGALTHLAAGGTAPGPKDMGPAMRIVQQRILANGLHADNKTVSSILKEELAKGA
ncbi:GatB/YqeY domain-containing protein [Terriglobus sp.]|uniref:GatB/YqeY domain-containing protein n=1 Tax=Terriglobus sp. TaxID=1889013 RepID=UPI003B0052CD